ncbi:MAG TPA: DegT/DnrJ/EryC1/StrS family aminotransferase [Ignavibacteriales bacterium]|nr:DegT/DnrJ/EryC1/StrS family aminotransferase [Ignavibacteriales bacterium]HOL80820.1 DegT/DnrJ/EryC1/StrS family aminotransferase [Ignavibacteriales bacterium]HOM66178.1 DegT/DnrJ/EryC1/StrS family aminotransferase [Ignavibacteriales bacterium]HPD68424.1 DegT/DnrJ/EryC1/StrS family aminotransferase [Ignavibacteriales bacterium]HPP33256.1 DegT/DnrJ/EryC1/StrS family aminotransferase [Ignavibacteriales bacterium]
MNVQFLNLKPQYYQFKEEIDNKVLEVLESHQFILGKYVSEFEQNIQNYLNVKYAIGVTSGTDALLIALMALDIKPGDEVIVPDYTFIATANGISRIGAVPVFVDIDIHDFNISIEDIKKKITPKTKAIIPVHLYGQTANIDAIMEIAKENNLYVIEDVAQAFGAKDSNSRFLGTIGHIGAFSFYPSKNLGGFGDGGMVTTNDEQLYKKLLMLRVHGSDRRYYHDLISGNFRLDALQACILNIKLKGVNGWLDERNRIANLYTKLFIDNKLSIANDINFSENNKVILPLDFHNKNNIKYTHTYNQYVIRIENKRDELKSFLADNGIGTEIYYPLPLHKQKCFEYLNLSDNNFQVSNLLAKQTLALPIYPGLKNEEIFYVVEKIKEFFNKIG